MNTSTVEPLQKVHDEGLSPQSYLNWNMQIKISKCINELYKSGKPPSFNDLLHKCVESNIIPNNVTLSQFEEDIKLLYYDYIKLPVGNILMENPEKTFERYFYLKTMLKMRENKHSIYYIDQRKIDTTLNFPKAFLETDHSLDDTTVFLYIISSTGGVKGIFTNLLDPESFSKWVAEMVLAYLYPNSIVVIDSYFKHTICPKEEVTMYDTKDTILKWLKGNGVPCSNYMRKAELFELYKKTPKKASTCDVSSMLEARGHRVLYLPSNLRDLCPTNFLWEDIKRVLKSENQDVLSCVYKDGVCYLLTRIALLIMPSPVNSFYAFIKLVQSREKAMFEIDEQIENSLDNLIHIMSDQNLLKVISIDSDSDD